MRNSILLFSIMHFLFSFNAKAQISESKPALVDYDAFENLVKEVKAHRQKRLISIDTFIKMSKEKNVVILDTRSDSMYQKAHIKGAIHLNFSDFTQQNLKNLIPNPDTKILIYCNNNFESKLYVGSSLSAFERPDLSPYFASKMAMPRMIQRDILPITLALNIPTYINLYGYGYRNVYELSELVSFLDGRIEYEGTAVEKVEIKN